MGGNGCQCDILDSNCIVRQQRWREVCAKFYFDQDESAKRLLDYFEAKKVDEFSISTEKDTEVDGQVNELVLKLGLQKCTVIGHEDNFSQTMEMLEVVKNDVRAKFHDHVSRQRYAEFNDMAKESQGTNYELWMDDNGQVQLSVRVQHEYLRLTGNLTKMMIRTEVFLEKHLPNVGCHPFLAGLCAVLQWNLESSTVVAWKLSDSVFVESGDSEYTHNAFALLVLVLNFSHCESVDKSSTCGASNDARVKTRNWYLDPFMSDHDIRQLIRQLPDAKRLIERPTGSKLVTKMDRVNVHGQQDETSTFCTRWCIVL
ncbi:unnamed protein product [Peronospora destructor]|uniref:Uncharacterized protein n=1 Tax=Peronospora destructor TaxID=86335 RepID=A0AAV0V689_9STRA|nr:unnamed protein product [Peronospora destructor]